MESELEKEKHSTASVRITEEQNKKLEHFIRAPLGSADRLMKELYSEDNFYETATYAWVGEEDAKKLFLYGVCKEVAKACVGLMNDKEFLQEVPSPEMDKDRMHKIIIGSITDAQTYRIRKMSEILSLLILFDKNTKNDKEYRIFLSAENLDLAIARQEDFKDLYEGRIVSNTQSSIDDFVGRIKKDMQELGVKDIWFLHKDRFKKQRAPVFVGKKKLYTDSLLLANADQRLALGISYGRGYSRNSQPIHPMFGSHDYGIDENKHEDIIKNFTHLSIICMDVMYLAYKIAGIKDPHGLEAVMGENFERSEAPKSIASLSKDFEKGDIVLTAWTDLAEVIDIYISRFGYKAYQVRYISRAPLPEYPIDWLESQMILTRLMTKTMVRPFYKKISESVVKNKEVHDIMREIIKLPEEELMKYYEKTFLSLHNHKVLIPMLLESGFLKNNEPFNF